MNIRSIAGNIALLGITFITVLTVICAKPQIITANGANVVYGQSMEPTIKLGDMVLSKSVDPGEVEIGDIILYRYEGRKIFHRVVEESDDNFRTQGDANDAPDLWIVPGGAVMGTYWFRIPYFGYIVHFIKSRYFSFFAMMVGGYLIFWSTYDTYQLLRKARRAAVKTAKAVKKEYDRLAEMMKAWGWRWEWWRIAILGPPLLCICGLRLNRGSQRFCVGCGKEVKK